MSLGTCERDDLLKLAGKAGFLAPICVLAARAEETRVLSVLGLSRTSMRLGGGTMVTDCIGGSLRIGLLRDWTCTLSDVGNLPCSPAPCYF